MPDFVLAHTQEWLDHFAQQGYRASALAAGAEGAIYDLGGDLVAKVWRVRQRGELELMQRFYGDVERVAAPCILGVLQALSTVPAAEAMRRLPVLDESQPLSTRLTSIPVGAPAGPRAQTRPPGFSGTMDIWLAAVTGDDSSLSIETMSDDKGDLLSLDVTEIANALVRPGGLWREMRVVGETGSTNADLLAQAGASAAEGLVLVAEAQTAGRGRQGRQWTSPPRAALTFSVLLRPRGVPPALLGWVPLLAGVAAASAVRAVTGVGAALKWPNDVLASGGKLGGILAERSGPAVVVGIGINVWQDRAGLPGDAATSLLLEAPVAAATRGGDGSAAEVTGLRERLLADLLAALSHWYLSWRDQASPGDADACGLRREYARHCATLGREVVVTMPGTAAISGTATGVDWAGRLEVRTAHGRVSVTAGDVVHVRPHDPGG